MVRFFFHFDCCVRNEVGDFLGGHRQRQSLLVGSTVGRAIGPALVRSTPGLYWPGPPGHEYFSYSRHGLLVGRAAPALLLSVCSYLLHDMHVQHVIAAVLTTAVCCCIQRHGRPAGLTSWSGRFFLRVRKAGTFVRLPCRFDGSDNQKVTV